MNEGLGAQGEVERVQEQQSQRAREGSNRKMNWQIINPGLTTDDSLTEDKLKDLCRDQNAVFHSVVKSFPRSILRNPPLGFRPIRIFYKSDCPTVYSTSDINYYDIGLSVLDRCYNQMAYQFAHEFCHIYADPRITNWFIESVYEMMSQYILKRLSKTWANNPPFHNWRPYAQRFKEYLDNHLREAHRKTTGMDDITMDRQTLLNWLRENMSDLENPVDRERNKIITEIAIPIFESDRNSWKIIPFLGKASSPYPRALTDYVEDSEFSFDRLEEIVPSDLRTVVQKLRSVLLL